MKLIVTRRTAQTLSRFSKNNSPFLVVAGMFAVAGIIFVFRSSAAVTSVSVEPEQGTLSGPVTKVTDTAASGGSYVRFGSTTGPIPGPNEPYLIDDASRTMTVNPIGDYTTNLRNLTAQLVTRADANNPWTLRLMPGTFTLTGGVTMTNLDHVHITSVYQNQPATVTKSSINVEYLFNCKFCNNFRISYLTFVGVTSTYDPNAIHWPDQGIYIGSSHDTKVDHSTFRNIGNAALRHNTRTDDPILGVNSYNHYIEDNTFENVWQVTTTQDSGTTHGGSRNWWVQRNTFRGMYGSLKFCSRTAGARDGHILNNTFTDSRTGSIEMCSTTALEIRGNTFTNNTGLVFSGYTNDTVAGGFEWGDDVTFADNTITGSVQGFRIAYDTYPDGYKPVGNNLVISGNRVSNLSDTDPNRATFRIVNGAAAGVTITNNAFTSIANRYYWEIPSGSTGITISGNTVNGAPFNSTTGR
jgi:hypothetical protein